MWHSICLRHAQFRLAGCIALVSCLAACGGASDQGSKAAGSANASTLAAAAAEVELKAAGAVASSAENAGLGADKAVDNNLGTRWSSAFTDQQSLTLDYGAGATFSRVRINWEAAYG